MGKQLGLTHFSEFVFAKAKKRANNSILYYRDNALAHWVGITWEELANKTMTAAKALVSLGVKVQQAVGICAQNMPQSIIVDFADFANRAISVPMYATASSSQIEYIVNDAKIEVLFVGEQEQYDNAIATVGQSQYLKHIVVFDDRVDLKGESIAMYFK